MAAGSMTARVREYVQDPPYRVHSFYFDNRRKGRFKVVLSWPKRTVTISHRLSTSDSWEVIDFWRVAT